MILFALELFKQFYSCKILLKLGLNKNCFAMVEKTKQVLQNFIHIHTD